MPSSETILSPVQTSALTLADVRAAAERLKPYIHRTPLLVNRSLVDSTGIELRLKCENLQRAGAFKIRGAMNALLQLSDTQRKSGVVAFSSGNHAQGVALAAKLLGMKAVIVMPEGAVQSKVDATRAYGAEVVQAQVTEATRGDVARQIAEERGYTIIPPFDHPHIIAGAATVGLEIVEEWPEVETIVVPVGGGGLLAGIALAATSINPAIRIFGVEPEAGNDAQQSFRSGSIVKIDPPKTIADGARTTAIGVENFAIIRERVTDIVTVSDEDLLRTVRFAVYRTKLLIEPTGALGIAAVAGQLIPEPGRTAVVVSGGNIDFSLLGPS